MKNSLDGSGCDLFGLQATTAFTNDPTEVGVQAYPRTSSFERGYLQRLGEMSELVKLQQTQHDGVVRELQRQQEQQVRLAEGLKHEVASARASAEAEGYKRGRADEKAETRERRAASQEESLEISITIAAFFCIVVVYLRFFR